MKHKNMIEKHKNIEEKHKSVSINSNDISEKASFIQHSIKVAQSWIYLRYSMQMVDICATI